MDLNYTTKGVGNAALTTGIIGTVGTAMELLKNNNGGILNGLIGGGASVGDMAQVAAAVAQMTGNGGKCNENMPVTRYDLDMMKQLLEKDNEISLLKSEQNTEIKIADVYERIMTRVNADRNEQQAWNAQQGINNATMSSAIAANASSIAALQNCCSQITKLVVPNSSICPGWGPVTVAPQPI